MENGALYRSPTGDISFGNFAQNPFHYLWEKKITSSKVADQFDCAFLCVGEPKCSSFNVAAYPDSKGLYLCELLYTDKYRAAKKFHANATFHHYSPRVRVCRSDHIKVFFLKANYYNRFCFHSQSPCESDPCKNGADCIPKYKFNSYRCRCKPGFYGTYCECAAGANSKIHMLAPITAPSPHPSLPPFGQISFLNIFG